MTMPNQPVPQQPQAPESPYGYVPPVAQPKEKNVLGIIALVVAIVGFIFACVPGALIVGWVLLPIAFILGLVSLFLKGKGKALGVSALIISVVGTVVGFVVFFAVVGSAFDEAFSGGEVTVTQPETSDKGESEVPVEADSKQGTRDNPFPVGTAITQGDWTVTVNSVELDATSALLVDSLYNEPPAEGNQFLMVNLTATYNGSDANGSMPMLQIAYVTADGNTVNSYDSFVMVPESFDNLGTLYAGASTTGNVAFEVPAATAGEGTLAVQPSLIGDKIFVAVM